MILREENRSIYRDMPVLVPLCQPQTPAWTLKVGQGMGGHVTWTFTAAK